MTALAADRVTQDKGGTLRTQRYPVATSTTIYKGALVCINASGYAVPAADTSGLSQVVGVAKAKVANTGANGAKDVIVEYGMAFLLDCNSTDVDQTNVGRSAFVKDDQTVTDEAGSSNEILVGKILEFDGTTSPKRAWVNIENANAPAILDGGVNTEDIADDAVTTDKIADDAVTADKIDLVVSAELTGTGSEQDFAHGLGAAPTVVLAILTEFADSLAVDIAYGTHDATNVKVTVASGAKFKILAIL